MPAPKLPDKARTPDAAGMAGLDTPLRVQCRRPEGPAKQTAPAAVPVAVPGLPANSNMSAAARHNSCFMTVRCVVQRAA